MLSRTVLLAVVSGLLLPATSAGQSSSPPAIEAALQPGDAVVIDVWRQEEFSGEFLVTADGTIAHPLLRSMDVTGVSLDDVEAQLRALLEQYEANPEFVVSPRLQVAVGGEVRQPNLYRLPPETTVAQAVAAAGGLSDRGQLDRVRVIRDGREIQLDITQSEGGGPRFRIRSGDQIIVGRRVDVFREYIAPTASIVAAAATVLRLVLSR